jgi:hypothetical protein
MASRCDGRNNQELVVRWILRLLGPMQCHLSERIQEETELPLFCKCNNINGHSGDSGCIPCVSATPVDASVGTSRSTEPSSGTAQGQTRGCGERHRRQKTAAAYCARHPTIRACSCPRCPLSTSSAQRPSARPTTASRSLSSC